MKTLSALLIASTLCALSALAGCGQTGPLYRADDPATTQPVSAVEPVSSVSPISEQDPNDF